MERSPFDGFVLSPIGWVREWTTTNEETEQTENEETK